jgi:hypothetical protein
MSGCKGGCGNCKGCPVKRMAIIEEITKKKEVVKKCCKEGKCEGKCDNCKCKDKE